MGVAFRCYFRENREKWAINTKVQNITLFFRLISAQANENGR
jgi:hypothetical protein